MTEVNNYTKITSSDVFALAGIVRNHRAWHRREQYNYALHPIVVEALALARPVDWHQLVLEWPHASVDDHSQIAYTRDEGKGEADVQTRTGAGKYLARHWPKLPSNVLRDMVAAHVVRMNGSCMFLPATTEDIVKSVQQGPRSCMCWDEDMLEQTGELHPYEVYAPELGWRAAVRTNSLGQFVGRALVHDGTHMRGGHNRNQSVFVRSYKCYNDIHGTTEYSHADEKLEAWLQTQGVAKASRWPRGTPFKHIDNSGNGPLLPYLDGNDQQVSLAERGVHYCIEDDSEEGYKCENTDGTADTNDAEDENRSQCERCGDVTDNDDMTYLEREEQSVCSHCLSDHYTHTTEHGYVRDEYVEQTLCGRVTWDNRGNTPDNVCYIDAGRYAGDYAMDDDTIYALDEQVWHVADIGTVEGCIVQLCDDSHHDGEYAPFEDCVQVEGEWFHQDDVEHDIIVLCNQGDNGGEYALADMHEVIGLGDPASCGIWHKADEWSALEPCLLATDGQVRQPSRSKYFVYLHDDSEFAGEAVDIVDAVLVPDVGWFMPMDEAAGNIVRIMDDVYALASDLVAA